LAFYNAKRAQDWVDFVEKIAPQTNDVAEYLQEKGMHIPMRDILFQTVQSIIQMYLQSILRRVYQMSKLFLQFDGVEIMLEAYLKRKNLVMMWLIL